MREITILTETNLRSVVRLDVSVVNAVREAFAALADGHVIMPPILSMAIPASRGEVDVKTAYVPGLEGFAIKVSPGFFDNPKIGLPSLNGLMVVLSSRTGLVEAVLLDNGYLTDIRTAAAGAVAARYLAPEDARTLTVFGTGIQARLQAEAACLVRPIETILVWGRDTAKAANCANDIAKQTGRSARAIDDAAGAVAASDIVITTTPATSPILKAEWLHPRLHITAMGSDSPEKNELEPAALARADRYVCDRISQCETAGELRTACTAGFGDAIAPVELGAVIVGREPGRIAEQDITVADLTGTGVQDTAIADLALGMCRTQALGAVIKV